MEARYQVNQSYQDKLVPSNWTIFFMQALMWIGNIAAVFNLVFEVIMWFQIPAAIIVVVVYTALTILVMVHFYYRVKEISEGKGSTQLWKTILTLIYCTLHIICYFSLIIANLVDYDDCERRRRERKEDGADFWLLFSILMVIFFTGGTILSIWYIVFLLVNMLSGRYLVRDGVPFQTVENNEYQQNMF